MISVDQNSCIGCGICKPYCPTAAFKLDEESGKMTVDPQKCTECWVCLRNRVCPTGALGPNRHPDQLSEYGHYMSDPNETTYTGDKGRGTEEVKTNDVTGRVKKGMVGFTIDMGRPGMGARFTDIEKVVKAVVAAGMQLEEPKKSPIGNAIKNYETGEMKEAYRDLFVLSIIIEGTCPLRRAKDVLLALKEASNRIDTVFSLGVALRNADGRAYQTLSGILDEIDVSKPYRGKVNVGLGRPLCDD